MLAEPPPTQGDIHFRVAGFPVRIHPYFWLMSLIMGAASDTGITELVLWVAVVLVSILVHELGHAVVQRHFGGRPRIVLHGFGGLAISDDTDRSPRSQILISLAGPAAGFLLAGVVLAAMALSGQHLSFAPGWNGEGAPGLIPIHLVVGRLYFEPYDWRMLTLAAYFLLYVNIFWGLINLLPVYPLDGGQVAREVLTHSPNVQQGIVRSMQLSMLVGGAVAVWGLSEKRWWMAILFGSLAYENYRTLQAYMGRGPGRGWG